ncbi:MAG: hypothetical protein JWP26_3043 [Devosia sp.]|uniref:hypothetical protein n=1 Tax=Devosia sp. TaxID=1871048 RepID=UPI00263921C1|nr:hypothetical protein [Devosia sp.]MDB5588073.1 hypothetical protein [Devosia sp.]
MSISPNSRKSAPQAGWPAIAANGLLTAAMVFGVILLIGAVNMLKAGEPPLAIAAVAAAAMFSGGFGAYRLYLLHLSDQVTAAREAAIAARYPDQPWMLNPTWAKGRLVDSQIGRIVFLWLFCAGWCGGIVIILVQRKDAVIAALSSWDRWGNWALGAFFILMTLMALNLAVKRTRLWLRMGGGVLVIDPLPGRLGGQFKARLETRLRKPPTVPIRIELTCTRRGYRRDGRPGNTEEQVWSAVEMVEPAKLRRAPAGVVVPVAFGLPAELPQTGSEAGATDIVWTLRIATAAKTGAMRHSWPVPVYRASR